MNPQEQAETKKPYQNPVPGASKDDPSRAAAPGGAQPGNKDKIRKDENIGGSTDKDVGSCGSKGSCGT